MIPAAGLACLINNVNSGFDIVEILWTFSIYLEAVAILPQLFMISKVKFLDKLFKNIFHHFFVKKKRFRKSKIY